MKINKVSLTRKYNLGNYETLDLSVEAELSPTDSIQDTWAMLQDQADIYMAEKVNKPKTKPETVQPFKPASEPQKPVIVPAKWAPMPPTDKGPWECTTDWTPDTTEIRNTIEAKNKPIFQDGALYWLYKDRDTGEVMGLGRRVKQ